MRNLERFKWFGRITLIAGLAILSYNAITAFRSANPNSAPAFEKAEVADELYYPVIPNNMPSEETMKPSGEFVISVLKSDGSWLETKRLKFDEFFRTQAVNIGIAKTIKIQRNGGGNAHLDAVMLGSSLALNVSGSNDNPLKKLAAKDADVIDATNQPIVLKFPDSEISNQISITGRIEKTVIGKEAFKFPLTNSYFPVTENSSFYTYQLSPTKISADSKTVFDNSNQLFKEYCIPGSGHPVGYTYGYVANDNANLYVRIDFNGDNTMDGDKDYTKVYVKTTNGLKEFKMSMADKQWGNPNFGYNNKVAYQHKIYDYTIPLTEISGIDNKLEMVFEAYGTCALPSPTVTVSSISVNSATVYVSGFSYGCTIIERGIVYATHPNPTISDIKVANGLTNQSAFSTFISGLLPSTTYYENFYVSDNFNTYYGNGAETSFYTADPVPVSMWSIGFAFIAIGLFTIYRTSKLRKRKLSS